MYRNFAIATLAITATIGIFADGESREAIASGAQEAQKRVAEYEPDKAPATLQRRSNIQPRRVYNDASDYADPGGSFGAPMDGSEPVSGRRIAFSQDESPLEPRYGNPVPNGYAELGLTEEELAELTTAEKNAMLNRLRQQRNDAAARMAEKSLIRSGRTTELEEET